MNMANLNSAVFLRNLEKAEPLSAKDAYPLHPRIESVFFSDLFFPIGLNRLDFSEIGEKELEEVADLYNWACVIRGLAGKLNGRIAGLPAAADLKRQFC